MFYFCLARRNTEEIIPQDIKTNQLINATITEKIALNNNNKPRKDGKKKSRLEKWQAALGPYPVVSPGTREASFVHAISSAGVAHAVTRSVTEILHIYDI